MVKAFAFAFEIAESLVFNRFVLLQVRCTSDSLIKKAFNFDLIRVICGKSLQKKLSTNLHESARMEKIKSKKRMPNA